MPAQTWDCACGAFNDASSPVCFACGRAAVANAPVPAITRTPAPDLTPADRGDQDGPPGHLALLTRTGDGRGPIPPPVRPTLMPPTETGPATGPDLETPPAPRRSGPVLPVGRATPGPGARTPTAAPPGTDRRDPAATPSTGAARIPTFRPATPTPAGGATGPSAPPRSGSPVTAEPTPTQPAATPHAPATAPPRPAVPAAAAPAPPSVPRAAATRPAARATPPSTPPRAAPDRRPAAPRDGGSGLAPGPLPQGSRPTGNRVAPGTDRSPLAGNGRGPVAGNGHAAVAGNGRGPADLSGDRDAFRAPDPTPDDVVEAFADRIAGFGSDLAEDPGPDATVHDGGGYLDVTPTPRASTAPGPGTAASLLDRRSSAALDAPTAAPAADRRNAVALSLAGLFEEDTPSPTDTTHPNLTERRGHAVKPTHSFFDEEPEVVAGPASKRRRVLLSPGGVIAIIAIIGALYVVGYVVARSRPAKPPSPDQITTTTR